MIRLPLPHTPALSACILLAGLATSACHAPGATNGSTALWPDAVGTVENAELAALCADAWELDLASFPERATDLGDPRYHGELTDRSLAGVERRTRAVRRMLERAEAIPDEGLGRQDRITLAMLERRFESELDEEATGIDQPSWNLVPRDGVHVDFLTLAADQPVATPEEREQMLERWRAMPIAIERQIVNLRRGLASGRVASREAATQVLAQLDALLATPPEDSPLAHPGRRDPGAPDPMAANIDAHIAALIVVRNDVYPAFERYRDFLAEEVLPRTRDDEHPGVMWVEGGRKYYDVAILRHTSLRLGPQQIHDYGLAEVARIRREMQALGEKVFGEGDVAAIQRRLREDPELFFATRAQVFEKAEEALARAEAAMPSAFGRLPGKPCEVVAVPDHEAPFQTIAYYRGPTPDGSRPGRYYINTYEPTTRPRYEAEALAYHESIPGHHLQITIAGELEGLPLVRRHQACTAFVEGWALYTERLADELGLYSGDLDRFGMLSFDAWRACRLVVDTGLHSLGWSRQRAIDYMVENTLLARNNVENEVDRYIAWPGQALAYKLGQREILALRAEAEAALGERFELARFHDRVLEDGGVTLPILRESIERWIRAETVAG